MAQGATQQLFSTYYIKGYRLFIFLVASTLRLKQVVTREISINTVFAFTVYLSTLDKHLE